MPVELVRYWLLFAFVERDASLLSQTLGLAAACGFSLEAVLRDLPTISAVAAEVSTLFQQHLTSALAHGPDGVAGRGFEPVLPPPAALRRPAKVHSLEPALLSLPLAMQAAVAQRSAACRLGFVHCMVMERTVNGNMIALTNAAFEAHTSTKATLEFDMSKEARFQRSFIHPSAVPAARANMVACWAQVASAPPLPVAGDPTAEYRAATTVVKGFVFRRLTLWPVPGWVEVEDVTTTLLVANDRHGQTVHHLYSFELPILAPPTLDVLSSPLEAFLAVGCGSGGVPEGGVSTAAAGGGGSFHRRDRSEVGSETGGESPLAPDDIWETLGLFADEVGPSGGASGSAAASTSAARLLRATPGRSPDCLSGRSPEPAPMDPLDEAAALAASWANLHHHGGQD
jgi:hypothetical protein